MTIRDVTPDFRAFWALAQNRSLSEQRSLWETAYASQHRDIFDLYFRDYAIPAHLEQALRRYPDALTRIDEISALVIEGIHEEAPKLAALLGAEDHGASLDYVALVGVFDSDAWEASFHERPTCFFAVERIPNPLAASVTVAHEVTHGLHALVAPELASGGNAVGKSLFLEGIAVLASALAVPGHTETDYLWMGARETPQGADVQEWVKACEAVWPELRAQLLRDFAAEDAPTHGVYFTVRAEYLRGGIPPRAGYFAGFRLAAILANQYPLAQVASWPREHALAALNSALLRAKSCPPALSGIV